MQFYPVVEPGPYELLKCHALRIKQQFHGVCCHFPIHGSSGICVQTSHSVGANIVDAFSCIQPANFCSRVCTLMGSLGRLVPVSQISFSPKILQICLTQPLTIQLQSRLISQKRVLLPSPFLQWKTSSEDKSERRGDMRLFHQLWHPGVHNFPLEHLL